MKKADLTLFTDGSSFVKDGQWYAGAAMTMGDEVLWQKALPTGTSAQRAELIRLTRALQIAEGKVANIYTDSHYAFAIAHVHGAIYKERGLLTAGGKDIKNHSEILALLDAIWLPTKVAIIHCKGHQKGDSSTIKGNNLADSAAREAATRPQESLLPLLPKPTLPPDPRYSPEEE
ncbi:ribonuclease H-like [Saccopteryx leptura]|uniref:ribonuclease H-like n=1 Tax=Saccopteryx leptura TaxID=249018 RepID=UPI00339BEFB0